MILAAVAAGGAVGAVCRYAATLLLARWLGPEFPWGTLAVNGAGSLVLGALAAGAELDPRIGPGWRALIGTGFCGGLTTFSTFSLETVRMPLPLALANVAGNLALSLAAAALGIGLVRSLHSAVVGG